MAETQSNARVSATTTRLDNTICNIRIGNNCRFSKEITEELIELGMDKQANEFNRCSNDKVILACKSCSHNENITITCKMNICPDCLKKRSHSLYIKYLEYVKTFKNPRFLTLTIKNLDNISREDMLDIGRYFRNFRYQFLDKVCNLNKGIFVKEVTEKGKGYHIHIHCVYDGSYLPKEKVVQRWKKATKGRGYIVDIKKINSPKHALNYILKYISKEPSLSTSHSMVNYFLSTRNVRMFQTFSLKAVPKKSKFACSECGSVSWDYVGINYTEHRKVSDDDFVPDNSDDEVYIRDDRLDRLIYHINSGIDDYFELSDIFSSEYIDVCLKKGYVFEPKRNKIKVVD